MIFITKYDIYYKKRRYSYCPTLKIENKEFF